MSRLRPALPYFRLSPLFNASSFAPSDATFVTLSADATLTAERILTGTANQITITDNGAGGTVVLSTPQNIHTAATPTFLGLSLSDQISWSAGTAVTAGNYSIGRDADGTNQLHLNIPTSATFEFSVNDVAEMLLSATNLTPGANDGNVLGSATVSWADLFLASGAVINFNNGDVTITHAADNLTFAGATPSGGYIFNDGGVGVGNNSSSLAGDFEVDGAARTITTTFQRVLFDNTGAITTNVGATSVFNLFIDEPNITVGTATPTNSASLYISGGATEATTNYALWVDAGTSAFGGNLVPDVSDVAALGTTALMWSDLFLASGGVINFNNGDVTITHAAATLTLAGISSGFVVDGIQIIDTTATEALLVRKDADAGDVFAVDTTNTSLKFGATANTACLLRATDVVRDAITPRGLLWVGAAHTNITASAEAAQVQFSFAQTYTWATGALTNQRFFFINAPTIAFNAASTVTNACTVYISGAPVAGTNATLTNRIALWIDGGILRADGPINQTNWTDITLTAASSVGWAHHIGSATQNFSNASSTLAIGATQSVNIATLTNDNATLTFTNVATLYIGGVPVASTNVAFTNPAYSLWIDSGTPRIDSTTANGTVATSMTSLGPAGSNTTIQEWLTININGNTRYIPCF